MSESIRLLVVDDHPVVRQGLIALLGTVDGMQVVADANDGAEAVKQYGIHQPDVTLMDLRLGTVGGVEAIRLIRSKWPNARIIVLTTFDGDEDIYRAMQAGAKAYLLKGTSVDELISAIRAVHLGRSRISPEIAEKLAERMSGPQLTNRELDVLNLIVHGRSNRGYRQDAYQQPAGQARLHRPNPGRHGSDPTRHHSSELIKAAREHTRWSTPPQ
jgi:DNA-binding NarL/FixJ family response regulator